MARAKKRDDSLSRPDIHDVARLAKVSIATVSRTINRVPTVDARLAQRVWKAIESLGYLPNTQARALVSGRSRLLGLIVSEITNPFFPELIQGFEEVAVAAGYEILVSSTSYDTQRMEVCIQRMLERKADGVAVMTFGIEEPLLDRLARRHVPLFFVDVAPKGDRFSTIEIDYYQGILKGVQHLAALGHRKLAFISGPLRLRSAELRRAAFLRALDAVAIPARETWMPAGDHTLEGGMTAMQAILAQRELPTAILTSNDMTAIGVMHSLYGAGYRVPQDFSVIGFDDVNFTRFMLPPLTSVRMSRRDIATCAVQALRHHLETPRAVQPKYHVPTSLTVRSSTGAVRASTTPRRQSKT